VQSEWLRTKTDTKWKQMPSLSPIFVSQWFQARSQWILAKEPLSVFYRRDSAWRQWEVKPTEPMQQ
jgi:hypothetical protein